MSSDAAAGQLAAEQAHLTMLYQRLDEVRSRTEAALDSVRRTPTTGTPQAVSERDAFDALYAGRLGQLRAVEDRLCFGRLDLRTGDQRYIGRIGLSDDDQRQLLIDWRAPAAEAYYQATAAAAGEVIRRRHLSTRGRAMTGIEDEVLDLDAFDARENETVAGEGALLLALNATRTGQMRDIVATIQAEQDKVVRAALPGILVVQGGPGTGKTAVALHRAAYLLYTHREQIARSGVLLVGPNPVFLRYIEAVLPSLGETGVLMATPSQLFPGVTADAREDEDVAALKGDLRMAELIAEAVRRRQRIPDGPRELDVDGTLITLRPQDVDAARHRARRTRAPHNVARVTFVREILRRLAGQLAEAEGSELGPDNRSELDAQLRGSRDVRREVNRCWLPLTPQQLLADLLSRPERLAEASNRLLSSAERALLLRSADSAWTSADVPLLDEAAELLGVDDSAQRAADTRAAVERRTEEQYARGVLEMTGSGGMVSAEQLADRYTAGGPGRSAAEHAAEDRTWAFGHVVVDEAQELSPMLWRLLMRRCPSRSMTVVGDINQTGSTAGASSWGEVFDPYAAGRWRVEELTVNYRTPAEIMAVAADVLHAAHPDAVVPVSARRGQNATRVLNVSRGEDQPLLRVLEDELARREGGSTAVIAPQSSVARIRELIASARDSDELGGTGSEAVERISVFTVPEVKGLEFDAVVLVEPAKMLSEGRHALNDLYVAMTRPTQRLVVLHTGELPVVLRRLLDGGAEHADTAEAG